MHNISLSDPIASRPYYLFPLLCVLVALLCQYSGLDIRLEKLFYDQQHHQWTYQSAWFTKKVLHDNAHDVVVVIFSAVILFFIGTLVSPRLVQYRRYVGYILLASLTGAIVVGILKSTTHMYTPWDVQVFGGKYPNVRLFDPVAENLPIGHAFPAGHASGGYAFLSFFFLARQQQFRHSRYLLYAALAAGLVLGIDQQVRGAHFLSHDLFTLAICWISCLVWLRILFPTPVHSKTKLAVDTG